MGGVSLTVNSWQLAVLIFALAVVGRISIANGMTNGPNESRPPRFKHLEDRVLTLQDNIKPVSYDVQLSLAHDPNNLHSLIGTVDVVLELGEMKPLSVSKKAEELLWEEISADLDRRAGDIKRKLLDDLRDRIARPNCSNYIVLNAGDLKIQSATLLVADSIKKLETDEIEYIRVREILDGSPGSPIALGLKEDMPPNSYGKLSLVFKSAANAVKSGVESGLHFGRSSPTTKFVYGSTDSLSKRSHLFPCFEYPELNTDFKLSVAVPTKYGQVVSNMPAENRQPVAGTELTTTTFKTTSEPIPLSQLSLTFGQFDEPPLIAMSSGGPKVKVLTPKGHQDEGKFALDLATRSIDWLQTYTGVEHPSKTIFLVGSPSVEAWTHNDGLGIASISHESLLVHESTGSIERKTHVAFIVGLAMARQWFGMMKRVDESRERWLIEGIAAHITVRMMQELEPSLQIGQYLRTKILAPYSNSDTGKSSVRDAYNQQNKPTFQLGSQKFQLIRGASIIQMYERYILGDATKFDSIMRSLVAGPELIETSQLVAAAAESGQFSRDSIELFFRLWTQTDRAPVLEVFMTDPGKFSVRQDCLYDSTTGICEQFWPIPMTVKFAENSGIRTNQVVYEQLPSLGFDGPDHTFALNVPDWYKWTSTDYIQMMFRDDTTLAYYRAKLPK